MTLAPTHPTTSQPGSGLPVPCRAPQDAVFDCDFHGSPGGLEPLMPYLPSRWQRVWNESEFRPRGFPGTLYPRQLHAGVRADVWPPDGSAPASSLEFVRTDHLDRWGIAAAVLTPMEGADLPRDGKYAAAVCSALNDWQVDDWVAREPRLIASIVVDPEHPDAAAREITRRAGDPRFRQVLIFSRTLEPLGRTRYRPLFAAAAAADLPVGIHFGLCGGGPVTGHGFPSFYIEDHTNMAATFQSQVTSLVCESVFAELPALRIVLIEGGLAWLTPLMWRLDRAWRLLRSEVPHIREQPSTVIREHFWLTTQPMEEPPSESWFRDMLRDLDMDDRVLFSSDYPHWDFDSPDRSLPTCVAPDLRARIMWSNACALYRTS